MDIKSIIRVFRFSEMQTRADRDPDAKRPPTVKFLGVALLLGLLLVAVSFWSAPRAETGGALPLAIDSSDASADANATADPKPTAQEGPASQPRPGGSFVVRSDRG